ncbi:MAG: HAD-IIIA family hydrolase, partial [Proteobacteria bacterium]|nr:HAD-IIIA family hydrolase [Pseudomonadota bacterium]
IVTNQPDVPRGKTLRNTVESIHKYIEKTLPIDAFYTCFHDDADHCYCRKPQPGLILTGALDWSIDRSKSYLIGDRWRDIEAGQQAGCKSIWLDAHYKERGPSQPPFRTVSNLTEAVAAILNDIA